MKPGDNTVSFAVRVKAISGKALLCELTEDAGKHPLQEWFPKSHIAEGSEIHGRSQIGDEGQLTVSEWIADQKGLL